MKKIDLRNNPQSKDQKEERSSSNCIIELLILKPIRSLTDKLTDYEIMDQEYDRIREMN